MMASYQAHSKNHHPQRSGGFRKLSGFKLSFASVRFRILIAYFLLSGCVTITSILVTRHIYGYELAANSKAALNEEVTRFRNLSQSQPDFSQGQDSGIGISSKSVIEAKIDQFFEAYVPRQDEFVITWADGQIQEANVYKANYLSDLYPDLLASWQQLNQAEMVRFDTAEGPILYAAEPIQHHGRTLGFLIIGRDARLVCQAANRLVVITIYVMIAILALFSWLTWIAAGRVLSPLRSLTQTAQAIKESDMTQRIDIQGNDEIAKLGKTFNDMLDRLQGAFESQQEFLKDAGHELRTPITVVQGQLELLKYRPERQPIVVELVLDELSRMNRLVNDLLLLAKAEQPDFLTLTLEELDWLTEELYLKSCTIAHRNWKLESKGLSPVLVDRHRFTQAVMNLVSNAVRHTKVGDTISLGSAVEGEFAYFWVRDTGEGIASADQARIFERFTRATHADRYAEGEGAGLGLSIVKAIAEAHHGRVELESILGQGSTFKIIFPLSSSSHISHHESDSDRRRQSSNYRISRSRLTGARAHDSRR